MQVENANHRLEIPSGMRAKLEAFRRRVWIIKLAEGLLAAVVGLLLSYMLVFALDRLWDTPAVLRAAILLGGAAGLGIWFPLKCHRWVWGTRRLEQVARLLRRHFPRLGDQLLGIVELAQSDLEQHRSEALCRAAMQQVDRDARQHDFRQAVPRPRHRRWSMIAAAALLVVAAVMVVVPAAGSNALARWLMPWKVTPRYTFAQLSDLPAYLVVPYAEPLTVEASLAKETAWAPRQGSARYGAQQPVSAPLRDGAYRFELPPQKEPAKLTIRVGDTRQSVDVQPTTRPELTAMAARVTLPAYLGYPPDLTKDVRGGSVSLLKGSRTVFTGTATRELAEVTLDGVAQRIDGNQLFTTSIDVDDSAAFEFSWRDRLGLSAKEPFVVSIQAVEDESPSIACSKLERQVVLLEDEVLSFEVHGGDDFGIKEIGMEWVGIEDPLRNPQPARGEKIVAAGGPQQQQLEATASFAASREGVPAQSLEVRLFAVDYLPDRERVYSPTYLVHVLTPEEHAIWLTRQLRKWFRQAQGVYEREQQLHATNKELRDMAPDELDRPETRRRLETQAAAEQTNARRLTALTQAGEELIQQAARNDQFNVATLESWAAMVQSLKDIAGNRMPSVADLLKQAASAPGSAASSPPGQQQAGQPSPGGAADPTQPNERQAKTQPGEGPPAEGQAEAADADEQDEQEPGQTPPQVGNNRDPRTAPGDTKAGQPGKLPSIVDVESGFNELDDQSPPQDAPPDDGSSGGGKFGLPGTAVVGGGPPQDANQNQACPVEQKVDEAVEEQEDLLAEFEKVADELQRILDNLEGSTFVKRLKAASRRQLELAGNINTSLTGEFGVDDGRVAQRNRDRAERIADRELAYSGDVYLIQDDLEAYYNRVQQGKFRTVLNEMKDEQVVAKLREVAAAVRENQSGHSIAQTEFWADALDRWAEQLVGPG